MEAFAREVEYSSPVCLQAIIYSLAAPVDAVSVTLEQVDQTLKSVRSDGHVLDRRSLAYMKSLTVCSCRPAMHLTIGLEDRSIGQQSSVADFDRSNPSNLGQQPQSNFSVIDCSLPVQRLVPFLRFRCGCHSLPSNTGRLRGVPRPQRLCSQCGSLFGDEFHLVFECPALANLRLQYQHLFASVATMRQFLWQQDLVGVVHYVNSALTLLCQRP